MSFDVNIDLRKTLLVALGVLSLLAAYGFGVNRNASETTYLQQKTLRLTQKNSAAILLNQQLGRENTELRLSSSANAELVARLQSTLADIHSEQARVDEELRMFRNLASGSNRESGLAIQGLNLVEQGERLFKADLTLTQARGRKRVSGRLMLEVAGVQGSDDANGTITLDLAKLTGGAQSDLAFDFRYFQTLEAEFSLPEGFQPNQVRVVAKPAKNSPRSIKTSRREFDWMPITLVSADQGRS